jgi:hypothetical protein
MKKFSLCIVVLLVIGIFTTGLFADSKADVKNVIEKSYFNGAFNGLDTVAMKKGFHPDFAIFSPKGNEISKYPIAVWIKGIEKRKTNPDFDISKAKMDCKIVSIDVTGQCASVKVEASKNGKLIYTDYLSLLRFEDGWKIVAKVYNAHK